MILCSYEIKMLGWLKLSICQKHLKSDAEKASLCTNQNSIYWKSVVFPIFSCGEETSGGPAIKRFQFVALVQEYVSYVY